MAIATDISLATKVFETISARLAAPSHDVALFLESGCSFEDWWTWEAYAACRVPGWAVRPEPSYSEVGLLGSREAADLLVFDPRTGNRVLVELAIVHDWTTNRWIATLNHDYENLTKTLSSGTTPLQIILAASLASPIEVNRTWKTWLEMTSVWKRPTDLNEQIDLGPSGQGLLRGWILSAGQR